MGSGTGCGRRLQLIATHGTVDDRADIGSVDPRDLQRAADSLRADLPRQRAGVIGAPFANAGHQFQPAGGTCDTGEPRIFLDLAEVRDDRTPREPREYHPVAERHADHARGKEVAQITIGDSMGRHDQHRHGAGEARMR